MLGTNSGVEETKWTLNSGCSCEISVTVRGDEETIWLAMSPGDDKWDVELTTAQIRRLVTKLNELVHDKQQKAVEVP